MKGIILAGGTGTRLWPLTKVVSKQLLPVYDKPLIYYPLSTLMLADIRDILIITTPQDSKDFQKLLGDGKSLGISISYEVQPKPEGIAQSLVIAEHFISNDGAALILGDNIFYGPGLGRSLQEITTKFGATIFGVKVQDPERYGVVEISESGNITSIEEKPVRPKSNLAVPGLYFFDASVSKRAKEVTKSPRGEFEITSVISSYLLGKSLNFRELKEGTAWMDCGTVNSLNEASNFVKSVEDKLMIKIGCIEEVAWRKGWIKTSELIELSKLYGSNDYGDYLLNLASSDKRY